MKHSEIETLLYEYLQDEMDDRTRDQIRLHIDRCNRCAAHASEMTAVLEAIPGGDDPPSSFRDEAYWMEQKRIVLERISQTPAPGRSGGTPERARLLPTNIPRWVFAPAGVALAAFLTVLIAIPDPEPPPPSPAEVGDRASMERYWRQSRSLLVGLNHMEIPDDEAVDLSAERQLSKELVLRGRSIQQMNIDKESYELISDLDQIMEHVSTTAEAPGLETIRREIRGRNLLIKLRMAEASASAPPVLNVSNGH